MHKWMTTHSNISYILESGDIRSYVLHFSDPHRDCEESLGQIDRASADWYCTIMQSKVL